MENTHRENNGTNPHVTITSAFYRSFISSTSTPLSFFWNALKWRPDLLSFHPGLHFEPFQGCVWIQKSPLQAKVSVSCVDEVGECRPVLPRGAALGGWWSSGKWTGHKTRAQAQRVFPITCTPLSPLVNTSNSFYQLSPCYVSGIIIGTSYALSHLILTEPL